MDVLNFIKQFTDNKMYLYQMMMVNNIIDNTNKQRIDLNKEYGKISVGVLHGIIINNCNKNNG